MEALVQTAFQSEKAANAQVEAKAEIVMTCSVVNTLTNACAADAPLLKAVKSREPRCSSANSEIPASAQVKAALCKRFGM